MIEGAAVGTFFTRELRRAGGMLQIIAGLVLVAMGLAMMTGYLSRFAFWPPATFPALGRTG